MVLTAIWGGSYTMVKLGFRDLPVFGSLFLRMTLATATLGVVALAIGAPLSYTGRARRLLAGNAIAFVWGQALLYLGLTATSAARASILFNTQPFFTLLALPLFVREERFTARRLAGTAFAFAGVVFVFLERLGGPASLWGDAIVLTAALGWSAGTIITKVTPHAVHPIALIFWATATGIPVMAILAFLLEPGRPWRLTPLAMTSVAYLAVISAAFSFVAFTWLIRHYSAIRINAFVFLSPVFGVLIGWAALGDRLSALQLVGAGAVAAGIYTVNSGA